jgi:hypothetical protein
MVDNITLFCLVHGDNPSRNAFPVEIDKSKTIGQLKEIIKTKKANDFKDVDADKLILWRVSISTNKLSKLDPYFDYKIDGTELSPYDDIQEVFPDAPAYKHIHIIVELPEVGQQSFRTHHFSRFRTPSPNLGKYIYRRYALIYYKSL